MAAPFASCDPLARRRLPGPGDPKRVDRVAAQPGMGTVTRHSAWPPRAWTRLRATPIRRRLGTRTRPSSTVYPARPIRSRISPDSSSAVGWPAATNSQDRRLGGGQLHRHHGRRLTVYDLTTMATTWGARPGVHRFRLAGIPR
jgi:hypothetical protein